MNKKLYKIILILCVCMIVCGFVYFSISSTIFTTIGYFQITLNDDGKSFDISEAGETYTIHCNNIVYELLSSIEEHNPDSYYYIIFNFSTAFPKHSILRKIQLDEYAWILSTNYNNNNTSIE